MSGTDQAAQTARFNGREKTFFRPLKRAPTSSRTRLPTFESVGYGSYDGYAADESKLDLRAEFHHSVRW
jgi:hypothetical protein